MKRVALVSCSAKKLKEAKANPDKEFAAKEIYTGKNFLKSINEGLSALNCDSFCILSGKYGLLSPDDKIKYYDCYLAKEKVSYKRDWSNKVYDQLQDKFGDLSQIEFIFFAGQTYYRYLLQRLNCKVLNFNGRHITFKIKELNHV